MGILIKAECDCGFQSEDISLGAGMREDHENTFHAPSICMNCKQMLNNNYYFKVASNTRFKGLSADFSRFFEIFLRYLIPGLVQNDKSENFLKFVFFLSLAFLGWCWIFMLGFGDSFYVGLFILLSVYVPSIIKTTRHYFYSLKSEPVLISNNLCPNCKNQVVFYNDPTLRLNSQINQKRSIDELEMDYPELYFEDFCLPKTKYFCPKCKNIKMEFAFTGYFD